MDGELRHGGAPDQVLELGAELLDVADVGPDGAVVEGADGRARPALRDVQDGIQVLLPSLALHDAVADLVDPPRGFPTRRALAARFVSIETGHHHEGVRNGHGLVHHDDAGGADHGALALGTVHVHGDVDLIGGQDGRGRAARHHRLEGAPAWYAATVIVDDLAEGHRHRRFDETGPDHVPGDRIQSRAALGLGPEPGEPLPAPVDDVRQARERLDIVHDGRLAEGAFHGREGRLDLGPALLALERRDEAGLLAADIGARPAMHDDLEVEARALDVLAEQARVVSLLDGIAQDAPGLDVLAPDVDEAQVRAEGARGDEHAFDQSVRIPLHEIAVLEGAGLALVRVDHEIARRRRALGDEAPLHTGGKARAAQPAEVGLLDLLGDGGRLHALGLLPALVAAALSIDAESMRVLDVEVAREDPLGHQRRPSRIPSTFSGVRWPS